MPAPQPPINDGYDYGSRPPSTPLPLAAPMGFAGTAEERDLVKPLLAAASDTPVSEVPDVAVLLWGPLMRGTAVSVT